MTQFLIENKKLKKTRILLIEDKPEDVELVKNMLSNTEENKFELIHAGLLNKALSLLRKDSFDIVLLNLLLDNKCNLETFRKVQATVPHLPIIALSRPDNEPLALKALKHGAKDYLIKKKENGNLLERSLCYLIDLKKTKDKLKEKEVILDNILNFSDDFAIVIIDSSFFIKYFNPAADKLFGYKDKEVVGKKITEINFEEKTDPVHFKKAIDTTRQEGKYKYTFEQKDEKGIRYIETQIVGIWDKNNKLNGFLLVAQDITSKKEQKQTLENLTCFDSLTGLPGRILFYDRMSQALLHAKRSKHMFALLCLRLDSLNSGINVQGQNAEKLLFKEITDRLKECVRKTDSVICLGKGEFTIILSKIVKSIDAASVCKKIIIALAKPLYITSHEVSMQRSIGISLYPADGNYTENLLKNAEAARYCAQKKGPNNYSYYTSELNDIALDRLTLESNLRKALEQNEFVLHYEPQIDINSGRINGMEALVRWEHPHLGLIYPREFIQFAEERGIIVQIGEWVLRSACAQNKAWQDAGYEPMRVAINLSKLQFQQQNLVNRIDKILNETGLKPCFLDLEITEDIIMKNEETIIPLLNQFKEIGIHLTIDDFGTGYSSLSYLKRLPVNKLKIDQSFVRTIAVDSGDSAISQAIIALAHSFNLTVIAEGVETTEQLKYLQSLKCDEAQGYLFSKHQSAETITELLSKIKTEGSMRITKILGIEEE